MKSGELDVYFLSIIAPLICHTSYKSRNNGSRDFHPFLPLPSKIVCSLNAKKNILFSTDSAFILRTCTCIFTLAAIKIPNLPPCVFTPIFRLQTYLDPLQISIYPLPFHTPAVCLRLLRATAHNPCASCQIILWWQINNATVNFI